MRIGIIGSGTIGTTAADLFRAAGHDVAVGSRSGPTVYEDAARHGELVLVATPFHAIGDLPAVAFAGRIVIDATNYYPGRDGETAALDADQTSSSELLAAHLAEARVVKAFNTMYAVTLAEQGLPHAPAEQRLALLLAGDDEDAKRIVAGLIEEVGFAPVDTGSLAAGGRRQQPGAPLYGLETTAGEVEESLRAA